MPVEIKELVVRVAALENSTKTVGESGQIVLTEARLEALVEQITRQVLQAVERKDAR